ncbi:MAG: hypothetical protein ACOX8B_02975 [Lachnospiraceae bacterium]
MSDPKDDFSKKAIEYQGYIENKLAEIYPKIKVGKVEYFYQKKITPILL